MVAAVTARGTDWTLAVLVALLVATGLSSWFVGGAWTIALHDIGGLALAGVLVWKFRRVLPVRRWRLRTLAGVAAASLVVLVIGGGVAWAFGADLGVAGFNGLAWHVALGGVLAVAVLAHMVVRAKRPRRRDVAGRRQLLAEAAIGVAARGSVVGAATAGGCARLAGRRPPLDRLLRGRRLPGDVVGRGRSPSGRTRGWSSPVACASRCR